jgi:hypothetical protein
MASKVWFIAGTSKGFGGVWAEAALARAIGSPPRCSSSCRHASCGRRSNGPLR